MTEPDAPASQVSMEKNSKHMDSAWLLGLQSLQVGHAEEDTISPNKHMFRQFTIRDLEGQLRRKSKAIWVNAWAAKHFEFWFFITYS